MPWCVTLRLIINFVIISLRDVTRIIPRVGNVIVIMVELVENFLHTRIEDVTLIIAILVQYAVVRDWGMLVVLCRYW